MVYTVKLPRLGEGIFEAQVVNLLVKEGADVTREDILADMQTDKAAAELQSPAEGKIHQILVKEGDIVYQGDPMILIDDGSDTAPDLKNTSGVYSGSSNRNNTKKESQKHANSQTMIINTDSASKEIESGFDTAEAIQQEHDNAKEVQGDKFRDDKYNSDFKLTMFDRDAEENQTKNRSLAMPKTRQYAKDKGVDLNQIDSVDAIIKESMVDEVIRRHQISQLSQSYKIIDQYNPEFVSYNPENEERVEINYIRKFNGSNFEMQHRLVPPLTLFDTVDIEPLLDFLDQAKPEQYLPFIIKALVATAKRYPRLNASIDDTTAHFVYKKYYNVGFDINTAQGMFTPVVHDADQKSIEELKTTTDELKNHILGQQFKWEDLSNATITITDNSDMDTKVGHFTPVIHYPQVSCLGLGTIQELPVIYEGEAIAQTSLPISLTVDYRVVDRVDGTHALSYFKYLVENPKQLITKL